MTGYLVSEEQIQVFERDGAIRLEGLVGEDWLAKLRAAAGEAMDMAPNDPGKGCGGGRTGLRRLPCHNAGGLAEGGRLRWRH